MKAFRPRRVIDFSEWVEWLFKVNKKDDAQMSALEANDRPTKEAANDKR